MSLIRSGSGGGAALRKTDEQSGRSLVTTVTAELVDTKAEAVKAELRLDMAEAVSGLNATIEKQNAAIEKQNAAIEKQNATIEKQGAEHTAALAKHSSALDQRLTTRTYWMFGAVTAGYLTLFGAVMALMDRLVST